MDKISIVSTLRKAKRAHKLWIDRANSLIIGIPIDKDQIPMDHTECAFGKWYFSDGQELKSYKHFNKIDDYHNDIHRLYREIFSILFGEEKEKKSFFGRIFKTKSDTATDKKKLAKIVFVKMKEVSIFLVEEMDQLEKELE